MISGEMDVVLVPQGTLISKFAVVELDLVVFSPQRVSARRRGRQTDTDTRR